VALGICPYTCQTHVLTLENSSTDVLHVLLAFENTVPSVFYAFQITVLKCKLLYQHLYKLHYLSVKTLSKMTPQFIVLAIISVAEAIPQFGMGYGGMGYGGMGMMGMGMMNPYMMGMGGMGMMWDEKTKKYVKDPENHAAQLGLKYKPSK
jgi:hypothetical protein